MEELGLEPRIYACKAYVIASLTKPPKNCRENLFSENIYTIYDNQYYEVTENMTTTLVAAGGARTHDLQLMRLASYHLLYPAIFELLAGLEPATYALQVHRSAN